MADRVAQHQALVEYFLSVLVIEEDAFLHSHAAGGNG